MTSNVITEAPPKRVGYTEPALFYEFLKLCSLVFADATDFRNQLYCKLALILLIINSENLEVCALWFDEKLATQWEFPLEARQYSLREDFSDV